MVGNLDSGLKTLKDLNGLYEKSQNVINMHFDSDFIQERTVGEMNTMNWCVKHGFTTFSERLKAEAIKWIKELEKGECDCPDYERGQCDFCANEQKISWIIDFFNITDSDLKEAKT